jgi:hypothetical protein
MDSVDDCGSAGDRVALTDPEYLFAERILRFLGAEVVRVPLHAAGAGPHVDLQRLEDAAASGIRLFLTSNPNNPTGTVYGSGTVQGIARLGVQRAESPCLLTARPGRLAAQRRRLRPAQGARAPLPAKTGGRRPARHCGRASGISSQS